MKIDNKHPRAQSLLLREKLSRGVRMGIVSPAGLTAHGRGEAFDYLLGEKTHTFAAKSIEAAAAYLILAKQPILSVNGNTAVLAADGFANIAKILNCKVEVNLFHYSRTRVMKIERYFERINPAIIFRSRKMEKIIIPEIASQRKIMLKEGIGRSDCILIPLEDGDRCQTLIKIGKKVITVDLNPLSRTSRSATVTIVDNIVRCLPLLLRQIKKLKRESQEKLREIIKKYDNKKILKEAVATVRSLKVML